MTFIKKNKKNAFTLVEMLVSIAVFMSVMVIAISALLSVINANRKAQAIKSVVDNISFVVDSVTRNIELGEDYQCGNSISEGSDPSLCQGSTCNCSSGGTAFQFFDKNRSGEGRLVQYVFIETPNIGNGNIQQRICENSGKISCSDWGSWQSLTGPVSNVNIKNMKFYVLGVGTELEALGDKRQPRVIIVIEGSSGLGSTESDFYLQTSVSKMGRKK